jgi:hypothetical protein
VVIEKTISKTMTNNAATSMAHPAKGERALALLEDLYRFMDLT